MNWHLDVSSTEEREKILKDTATLGPWYQSFNLADWLKIQAVHDGDSVLDCLDRLGFPRDFSDKTVLDVLYADQPVMRVSSEARLRDRRNAFEGIVH